MSKTEYTEKTGNDNYTDVWCNYNDGVHKPFVVASFYYSHDAATYITLHNLSMRYMDELFEKGATSVDSNTVADLVLEHLKSYNNNKDYVYI